MRNSLSKKSRKKRFLDFLGKVFLTILCVVILYISMCIFFMAQW